MGYITFITGRGCGLTTPLKYLEEIPQNLDDHKCSFIPPKSKVEFYCDGCKSRSSSSDKKNKKNKHPSKSGKDYVLCRPGIVRRPQNLKKQLSFFDVILCITMSCQMLVEVFFKSFWPSQNI